MGENPDGFDTCLVNHEALRERLGVAVAQFELEPFFQRARQADSAKVAAVADGLSTPVGFAEMDQAATKGTLGAYTALDELVRDEKLSGMAVRCWPEFFTDLGCSACGAMSLLTDAMTPCSCEADVNGTITQLILQWISSEPSFGSDLVTFDVEADEAVLWHCGLAPLSMADPDVQPQATIHSNRQKPLLMQFPLKPGRVTIARLSEATGEFRLVIGGGEMLKASPAFTGTSGRIRFDSGAAAVMDTIMREGLEHHVSLTYGDHQAVLESLAGILVCPCCVCDGQMTLAGRSLWLRSFIQFSKDNASAFAGGGRRCRRSCPIRWSRILTAGVQSLMIWCQSSRTIGRSLTTPSVPQGIGEKLFAENWV